MTMEWTPVLPLQELPSGSMKARAGLLLIHQPDGSLYATENACPHQGYPLSQGSLSGCMLTCTWHNFKFDIRDGSCVMGEESLRTHPVRVLDGMIEVQRDQSVDVPATWASLDQGLRRAQVARSSREAARLLRAGVSPAQILAHTVAWDTNHCEYGVGHSGALAADLMGWMELPSRMIGAEEHRVQMLGEVMELSALSVLGLPERSRPEAEPVGEGAATELARRVEAEDAAGAEALVRGMILAGWTFSEIEAAIYPIIAEHFLDFGHPYIYMDKYRQLIEAAGWEWADPLLGGLIFGITNGTREDLLPPWASLRSRWKKFAEAGGPERALAARIQGRGGVSERIVQAVLSGTPGECFEALAEALVEGRWEQVLDSLVEAGAQRFWRFNPSHDADPSVEEGWLDVTHRFTVPQALHGIDQRWRHPSMTKIIFMVGHFINLGKALDRSEAPVAATVDLEQLRERVLAGRSTRGIFFAHDVKTLVAATRVGSPTALQAVHHYLSHPAQERPTRKAAVEAVRLVRDGKPPHGLSG